MNTEAKNLLPKLSLLGQFFNDDRSEGPLNGTEDITHVRGMTKSLTGLYLLQKILGENANGKCGSLKECFGIGELTAPR